MSHSENVLVTKCRKCFPVCSGVILVRIHSVIRNDNKFVMAVDVQSTYHVFEGYS